MTPDVCAEMDADGIERSRWFANGSHKDVLWSVEFPIAGTLEEHAEAQAAIDALDPAGTCAVPSVRWSGWAIFTEDGDLDYYAYATDEEAALAIARDAGCEGDIYAIEDGDGVGTCQEVA